MTGLRYADGTPIPPGDLEVVARAFGFTSVRAWLAFHAAAEHRRGRCCSRAVW
ncbi:hypothetical protein [Nocardia sp. NPDC051570]|uniref:hypothetical protein n=1 Tax=Nocardia sp. NPDC051570 TaxID=3364324 RepID=UPI0037B37802